MRPHRRVLFFVGPDPDARDCYGYCGTPPWPPTVPSSPDQGPAPSPAPASSPLPACPPISLPPAPSPSAHRGRRNQGGGMNGYGPPPPLGGGDDHRWHYVRYALIAAGVIAFVSLILLGVSVAVRRRQVRRRRQAALLAPAAPPPPGAGGAGGDGWNDDLEGGGGGGGGGVVHHVWYIRTVGLDEAAINSIAATRYRAGAGLLGAADCSVCLGEFQDGELVRLLPKCAHAFHVPCIDTWLRAHVNCPLCRSDVIDPAVTAATGHGGGVGGEVSSDPPADLDANDNVEAEQPAAASDAIPDHEQEDRDIGHQEEQEASPAVVEDQQERSSSPDPPPPPPPQQQQQQFCSLPRNVRRAASMDPATVSTAADVAARERLPEAAAPEEEQIGGRRKRSCAKASGSGGHRSNLSIDRQASVGIPRSFFSRHSRARSSVLPLSYPS